MNVIPRTPPYLLKGRQRGEEGLRDSHHPVLHLSFHSIMIKEELEEGSLGIW